MPLQDGCLKSRMTCRIRRSSCAAIARENVEEAPNVGRNRHINIAHQLGPQLAACRTAELTLRTIKTIECSRIVAARLGKQMIEQF